MTKKKNLTSRQKKSWQPYLGAIVLLAVTVIAYSPALHGQPIWDDEAHLTRLELRSFHGLIQIWTQPEVTQQYYPLVHTVFWLEQKLWEDALLPVHLVNVLLHGISSLILLGILQKLRIPGAWLAAGIFALHPIQVESVAWISELKNTLSGVFFLAAALTYLRFDQTRKRNAYFIALALFLAGLMCKTVIAPLPAALLVVFWWRRGRLSFKQDFLPLIPFFVIGLSAGLFTAWVEHTYIGAQGADFNFSFFERCLIAGRAFWFYLGKLAWPADLIFIYPRWHISHAVWWQYLFPLAALALLVILWILRRRSRAPLAAILFFAGMLFPALGFFNVYPFVYSFVADHFQYLAGIGVITLLAAGFSMFLNKMGPQYKKVGLAISALVLTLLGGLTYIQAGMYRDAETLYRTTLQRNPGCWMAHDNLGVVLRDKGMLDGAITQYHKALELKPNHAQAHYNLGIALRQKGQTDEAIAEYRQALKLRPNYQKAHNNLGNVLFQTGRTDEAIDHYRAALELQPDYAEAHNNLGNALTQKDSLEQAVTHYNRALEIRPNYTEARFNLAGAYARSGKIDEAIIHYREALREGFNRPQAFVGLGDALQDKGLTEEALMQYESALRLATAQGNTSLATRIEEGIASIRTHLTSPNKSHE